MDNIKWEEGAVCFAGGLQFGASVNGLYPSLSSDGLAKVGFFDRDDFQLNEIRQGDYIKASELDTEQKYNDAVEVFEMFGFPRYENCTFNENLSEIIIADEDGDFTGQDFIDEFCKRKITYSQLMAIGKLKRAMIECDEVLIEAVENTSILKDTLEEAREDFVKATDKAKSLQQDFSSEQAILDCNELDINVVFTGEGVYILDCINSVEYQLESVDEYSKVVSAIRLLQSKER